MSDKEPNIINEIYNFKNCEIALFTTFNFDIAFFDKSILPLLEKQNARTCIFVDSNKFKESINDYSNSEKIGMHYFVQPFMMEKAFHPKLILLLGKGRAKLIVSSANLTYSSYYSNNEIFQSYDYSESNNLLFIQAFDLFKKISNKNKDKYVEEILKDAVDKYSFLSDEIDSISENTPSLLNSFSKPIIEQIEKIIPCNEVFKIKVAVPFYDEGLLALKRFNKSFPNASIDLYIQQHKSTFPKNNEYTTTSSNSIKIFETVNNNNHPQKKFYHGKVFCFSTKTKDYILFGSANFSSSALLKHYDGSEGNVEASVIDEDLPGSFNEFFDSFITENIDINSFEPMKEPDKSPTQNNVIFINGQSNSDYVSVYLSSETVINQIQLINDDNPTSIEIDIHAINDNKYLVNFKNILKTCVFDLLINGSERVRCFACNIDYLNNFANRSKYNPFKKYNDESSYENNIEDFLNKFQHITSDIKLGIQQKNAEQIMYQQTDVNDDTKEEEPEEEAQFDSILYEDHDYMFASYNNEIFSKATDFLSYHSNKVALLLTPKPKKENTNYIKDNKEQTSNGNKRERKSQSFINKITKLFLNYADKSNSNLNGLNFDIYFNLYELFSESFIYDMYIDKTKAADISKLAEIKINYLINRLLPSIESGESTIRQSDQYNYLKKEIALLCLECCQYTPRNIDDFKAKLIKLDKQSSSSFIDELIGLMEEVSITLTIPDRVNRIETFKHIIINSPKENEIINMINNYFCFSSSNTNISADISDDTSILIEVRDVVSKDSFTTKLQLESTVIDNICNYARRKYDIVGKITINIIIVNYTENISELRFVWNETSSRYHTIVRTMTRTGRVITEERKPLL